MELVYAPEDTPESLRQSIFLAGPTPRTDAVDSWRPEMIKQLKKAGFDGTVFVPEPRGGEREHDYLDPGKLDTVSRKLPLDSDPSYACLLLKAFMYLKGGLQRNDEAIWGQLDRISRKSSISWAAAASYILGKYYEMESSRTRDPIQRNDYNLRSLRHYRRLSNNLKAPVALSSDIEILLPGIRSEAPPEKFTGFVDFGDPSVNMIFPPYRYLATRSLAMAQSAQVDRDIDGFKEAMAETEFAITMRRDQGLDSLFLEINIDICDAAQKCFLYNLDEKSIDRSVLRERFETILEQCTGKRAKQEIDGHKRLEWIANSWAGIAFATRGADRDDALEELRHFAERTANARQGRVSFFKTDGIFQLVHSSMGEEGTESWNAFVEDLMVTRSRHSPTDSQYHPSTDKESSSVSSKIFLSHNSNDKPIVRIFYQRLIDKGLDAWMDERNLKPCVRWVRELQKTIARCRGAIIFYGGSGLGKWHEEEIESLIIQKVERGLQLIAVLLPEAPRPLTLPPFLDSIQNIDIRGAQFTEHHLDTLALTMGLKK
tara:strand:- start:15538 stop:17166 length:1629 start_codon:yes stop_codon:yes gene_type:complete